MQEKLYGLSNIKSSKKKAFNDAMSDNMTVYNVKGKDDDDGGDLDMKSMKSRTSLKSRKKKKKKQ